tara:strand:- start:1298 stop:1456 length:159 start_codon:yes stop_codon:yes gene_type:complete
MSDYIQVERIENGETFQIIKFECDGTESEFYRLDKTEEEVEEMIHLCCSTNN